MSMTNRLASLLNQLAQPPSEVTTGAPSPTAIREDGGIAARMAHINVDIDDDDEWVSTNLPTARTDPSRGTSAVFPRVGVRTRMTSLGTEIFDTPGAHEGSDGNVFFPASTSSTIDSASKTGTTHNVFIFPTNQDDFDRICLKEIGVGVTICIRRNCNRNHRGWTGKYKEGISTGTISVLAKADKSAVFAEPFSNIDLIDDELLSSWTTGPKRSLDQWTELFRLSRNVSSENVPVTAQLLDNERSFQNFARKYHPSPRNSDSYKLNSPVRDALKGSPFKALSDALNLVVKRKAVDDANASAHASGKRRIFLTGDEEVEDAFYIIEETLEATKDVLASVAEKLDKEKSNIGDEVRICLSRTQVLESSVGTRIELPIESLQAPTVWGSLALLTNGFNELCTVVQDIPEVLQEAKSEMIARLNSIETQMRDLVHEATRSMENKIHTVKLGNESTIESIELLTNGMAQLAEAAVTLRRDISTVSRDSTPHSTDLTEIRTHISSLSKRIDDLMEDKASKAEKFFGITLRDQIEANAWVKSNLDDDSLGVIVDVPLVFEHIYYQSFATEGILKTLQALYKVKIDTIAQGLACASFDVRVPKFFHMTGSAGEALKATKRSGPDSSAFNAIESWAVWNQSSTGYRSILESQLVEFKKAHATVMGEYMVPGTPAYNVALMSVTASTSWVSALITYIDRTYREFAEDCGFSTARSWHIVTSLVQRIFKEITEPRIGIGRILRLNDNQKTNALTFWPMVQCHGLMKVFDSAGFKDHPVIAAEFTDFIMKNSASDVTKLKISKLEEELISLTKTLKATTTAATTASNNASEAKKLVDALQKTIDKLAKK